MICYPRLSSLSPSSILEQVYFDDYIFSLRLLPTFVYALPLPASFLVVYVCALARNTLVRQINSFWTIEFIRMEDMDKQNEQKRKGNMDKGKEQLKDDPSHVFIEIRSISQFLLSDIMTREQPTNKQTINKQTNIQMWIMIINSSYRAIPLLHHRPHL